MPSLSQSHAAEDAGAEDSGPGNVRVLKPRRAAPADAVRPTRAEVNLANLRHNLRALERSLAASPDRAAIWGVLKADAYGHGAPAVARTLERAGIGGLCVALLEEAVELRAAGIRIPILVMGGYYGTSRDGIEELLANELVPVLYDPGQIERIAAIVRSEYAGTRIGVHLKVDTGMARLGTPLTELDPMLDALARFPEIRIDGLMTHLACADADDPAPTHEQLRRFDQARARMIARGVNVPLRHAANSAAMLRFPETRFDVVRPGVALFGVTPFDASFKGAVPELRPVMRVRTEIVALRTIEAGERIGYGHTWSAPRRSVIATVPLGYADGLSRQLSNRGHGLVRGRRAPIVGTISMDMAMLDVTDLPGASVRDEAVFLGAQDGVLGQGVITADEIAQHVGTIPWEVLTSISRRVPRFYREP